jgi:hypothetical protein
MPFVRSALAVGLCLGAASAQTAVTGKHFQVEFRSSAALAELAPKLAEAALAAVEAAWPVLEKQLPPPHPLPVPLVLYADRVEYQRAVATVAGRSEPREHEVAADGSQAHVLLWPQLSPKGLARIGLPRTTAQVLVKAGAEALARRCLGKRPEPWLAEVIALGVLELHTNPKRQFGVDPHYDARRIDLAYWRERNSLPNLQGLLPETKLGTTRADRDQASERRALVAELLLGADAGNLRKAVGKWLDRKGAPADREALVLALLGDWSKAEPRFSALAKAAAPVWQASSEVMWREGDSWWLLGAPDRHVCVYHVASPPAGDYTLRGTFQLEPFEDAPSFRVQLDQVESDLLCVFFDAPNVTISQWQPATSTWRDLAGAPGRYTVRRPTDFRIDIVESTILVTIDGQEALRHTCTGRTLHGRWGVASGDTLVQLDGLSVAPRRKS